MSSMSTYDARHRVHTLRLREVRRNSGDYLSVMVRPGPETVEAERRRARGIAVLSVLVPPVVLAVLAPSFAQLGAGMCVLISMLASAVLFYIFHNATVATRTRSGHLIRLSVSRSFEEVYADLGKSLDRLAKLDVSASTAEAVASLRSESETLACDLMDAYEVGHATSTVVNQAVDRVIDMAASAAALADQEFELSSLGAQIKTHGESTAIAAAAGQDVDETLTYMREITRKTGAQ